MTIAEVHLAPSDVLTTVPTCELQWELERREGVTIYKLGPEPRFNVVVDGVVVHDGEGPCTLTVNID